VRFEVFVERDLEIEASNDRQALAAVEALERAVEAAIAEGGLVKRYARTYCRRGSRGKAIFDAESGEPAP